MSDTEIKHPQITYKNRLAGGEFWTIDDEIEVHPTITAAIDAGKDFLEEPGNDLDYSFSDVLIVKFVDEQESSTMTLAESVALINKPIIFRVEHCDEDPFNQVVITQLIRLDEANEMIGELFEEGLYGEAQTIQSEYRRASKLGLPAYWDTPSSTRHPADLNDSDLAAYNRVVQGLTSAAYTSNSAELNAQLIGMEKMLGTLRILGTKEDVLEEITTLIKHADGEPMVDADKQKPTPPSPS